MVKQDALMERYNKGFGLVYILLGLVISSIIISAYIPWKANQERKERGIEYAHNLTRVISGIQQYQYWQINNNPNINPKDAFPFAIRALMNNNGQWWPKCSDAEYKNKMCMLPDLVLWNANAILGYVRINEQASPPYPAYAEITVPLGVLPKNERGYWKATLIQRAHAKEEPNGNIKIKVFDPMISLFYKKAQKDFLRKDGSTPLEGDWDVGNKAITNASMMTVRNQAGKQTIMGTGTVKEFTVTHGKIIPYSTWDCPAGLKKTIHLSINAKIPPLREQYIGLAGEIPYYEDHYPSYFVVKMDYNAKLKSIGQWQKMHTGYITVRLNCSPIN